MSPHRPHTIQGTQLEDAPSRLCLDGDIGESTNQRKIDRLPSRSRDVCQLLKTSSIVLTLRRIIPFKIREVPHAEIKSQQNKAHPIQPPQPPSARSKSRRPPRPPGRTTPSPRPLR